MKRLCKKHAICMRMFITLVFSNIISKPHKLLQVNYIKIKPIAFVFILSLIFLNCEKTFSQTTLPHEEISQKRHFIAGKVKELYEQKTKQPDTLFKMEPKMNEVTKILSSDTFQIKHAEVDKDVIRKLLHEQFIYDYQVHYIKIPLKNLRSNTIEQQIKEHELLKEIIENPYVNRMGIDIEVVNDEHLVHLLFTERYIDFDEVWSSRIGVMDGGGVIEERIIKGESFLDALYYNNISQKALDDFAHIREKKIEIQLDSDNRFSIYLNMNANVYYMDKDGKILANQNFSLY